MAFKIINNLTTINFTDKNNVKRIKYIVIHYFGALGTAFNVSQFFKDVYRGASAHYSLDEGENIYCSVLDADIAWHCGAAVYVHPDCRNSNSIGIEVRPFKINSSTLSAADKDWYFTAEIIDRLVEFVQFKMKEYNLPIDAVIRHYDVTGKLCPRPMMGDDINTYHKTTGNLMWKIFKERLAQEEDDMAKVIELIAQEAGLTVEQTIKGLGVLCKFANTTEESWESNGAQSLMRRGLITSPRDGRELVEFGELGVILDRLITKYGK